MRKLIGQLMSALISALVDVLVSALMSVLMVALLGVRNAMERPGVRCPTPTGGTRQCPAPRQTTRQPQQQQSRGRPQATNSNSFVQVLYLSFLVRHYCVCEQSWQTDTCGGDHSATVCDPRMRTVNTGVECGAWDDWYYYR